MQNWHGWMAKWAAKRWEIGPGHGRRWVGDIGFGTKYWFGLGTLDEAKLALVGAVSALSW